MPLKLLLFILLFLCFSSQKAKTQKLKIPIIQFEELQKHFDTKDGTVTIYNFWATWCKPCVEELPDFLKFAEDNKDKRVKLVLVSLDFRKNLKSKLIPFIEKNHIDEEVLLLDDLKYNSWIDKVSPDWGGAIPVTLIIDKKSGERKFHDAPLDYKKLENLIQPFIKN